MQTTLKRSAWCREPGCPRSGILMSRTVLAILACLCCWGCNPAEQVNQAAADKACTITLDREDNGAAVASTRTSRDRRPQMQRVLSFEMAGFSSVPDLGVTQEQRAAATQAAIIDAFCKALIEARRARGQTDSDFTARLGPRLTVTHRPVDDGYQVEANLISRGAETTFVVRDGQLQHQTHDVRMIHRLFEETNGEFSLLGTEWSSDAGACVAKVGCYLPAGLGEALAGDAAADEVDEAP